MSDNPTMETFMLRLARVRLIHVLEKIRDKRATVAYWRLVNFVYNDQYDEETEGG